MKNENQNIIDEIQQFLPQMDRESLQFLKDQASVLLYNKEVKERNNRLKEKENHLGNDSSRKKSAPKAASRAVYFEQLENKKFFNLSIGSEKIFMDRQEIKAIFKIAKAAETDLQGASRLYKWFKKERKDVLVDGHISHRDHPLLKMIYKEIMETFSAD